MKHHELLNGKKKKSKTQLTYSLFCCTLENFLSREGQISREEITSYFMRGMSICAKLGYNFKDAHNFHETTYKRPTFCDTCGGFVSIHCFFCLWFYVSFGQSDSNMIYRVCPPNPLVAVGSHQEGLPLQR